MDNQTQGLTPEQSAALTMLFEAHHDRDPLRIRLAETHLEFLADVQGLPRLEKAA